LLRGNADAGVADLEAEQKPAVDRGPGFDDQFDPAFFGELDGVVQQVEQDLVNALFVAGHGAGHFRRAAQRQVQPLGHRPRRDGAQGMLGSAAGRERLALNLHVARLDLGQVEDVVQQVQQAVGGELHRLQVFALFLGQVRRESEIGHAEDAVHGRANLMRNVGEELVLQPVGALASFLLDAELARALLDGALQTGLLPEMAQPGLPQIEMHAGQHQDDGQKPRQWVGPPGRMNAELEHRRRLAPAPVAVKTAHLEPVPARRQVRELNFRQAGLLPLVRQPDQPVEVPLRRRPCKAQHGKARGESVVPVLDFDPLMRVQALFAEPDRGEHRLGRSGRGLGGRLAEPCQPAAGADPHAVRLGGERIRVAVVPDQTVSAPVLDPALAVEHSHAAIRARPKLPVGVELGEVQQLRGQSVGRAEMPELQPLARVRSQRQAGGDAVDKPDLPARADRNAVHRIIQQPVLFPEAGPHAAEIAEQPFFRAEPNDAAGPCRHSQAAQRSIPGQREIRHLSVRLDDYERRTLGHGAIDLSSRPLGQPHH